MTFNSIVDGDALLAATAMQNWRHVNYGNDLIPVTSAGVGVTDTLNLGAATSKWNDLYADKKFPYSTIYGAGNTTVNIGAGITEVFIEAGAGGGGGGGGWDNSANSGGGGASGMYLPMTKYVIAAGWTISAVVGIGGEGGAGNGNNNGVAGNNTTITIKNVSAVTQASFVLLGGSGGSYAKTGGVSTGAFSSAGETILSGGAGGAGGGSPVGVGGAGGVNLSGSNAVNYCAGGGGGGYDGANGFDGGAGGTGFFNIIY